MCHSVIPNILGKNLQNKQCRFYSISWLIVIIFKAGIFHSIFIVQAAVQRLHWSRSKVERRRHGHVTEDIAAGLLYALWFCTTTTADTVTTTQWGKNKTTGRSPSVKQQQQQQPFYGRMSGTTQVSWYQKKHSPTHHPDHHPIFISFFHLLWSIASSLFKLRAWHSFCTTSLHAFLSLKQRHHNLACNFAKRRQTFNFLSL